MTFETLGHPALPPRSSIDAVGSLPFPSELAPPSPRVLILESEPAHQQSLSHVLRREGFTPVTCATNTEAVGHLKREPFVVAIIGKPADQKGWESLLREVSGRAGGSRVILLAAADSPAADSLREHLDALVCLGRPYDSNQLISQVHWAFHHHLQQALSSVSHFQRRITETIPEHVYVFDLVEPRTIYSNRKLQDLLGYSETELGQPEKGLPRHLLHPDDVERFEQMTASCDGIDDSQIVAQKIRLRHKNGEWRWFSTRNVVFAREAGGRARRILGVVEDVTESERADEALRASREELRRLANHLQSVREKERGDIAREVHDQLGQTLTAMKLHLASLENGTLELPETVMARLRILSQLVESTVETVRRVARELRPHVVEDLGLMAAIRFQVEEFATRWGLECRFRSACETLDLSAERSTHLFRILQESLTNVARHAAAKRVSIDLTTDADGLTLTISDDGQGITAEKMSNTKSIGLIGIRERALLCGGRASFITPAAGGTRVEVWIPWS